MKPTVSRLHDLINDFVWGKRDGRRRRPWVPEAQAELPSGQGGLSVPNIATELTTLAAKTVGTWATTAGHRELLLGDILWGDGSARPIYITPTWGEDARLAVRDTLWETGATAVGAATAEHARGGDAERVKKRARRFLRTIRDTHNADGSISFDVSSALDTETVADMRAEEMLQGRVDPHWLEHASLSNLSWLLANDGKKYELGSASFSVGAATLGDALSWTWTCPGKIKFTPRSNLATAHAAKTRRFASFCRALLFNFPVLLRRPPASGPLVAYAAEANQHHDWVLDDSGRHLVTYDAAVELPSTQVHSMVACDRAATRTLGSAVHFRAHPSLTRITQIWPGERRWRPRAGALKKLAGRYRAVAGEKLRDQRIRDSDHRVVTRGMDLVDWNDLRRIRATSPYVAQTLYRLKSNRFPLWNRSASNLSCPASDCSPTEYARASHVFWACPTAKRQWRLLLDKWRRLGDLADNEVALSIFALELPEVPSRAWDTAQGALEPHERTLEARDVVFGAANELWRFVVATTIHAIWLERLRRMEDSTISMEGHCAIAQAGLRRAITRFRSSTYQPGGGPKAYLLARVRSTLADELLRHFESPPLQALAPATTPSDMFLLFFDGGSRGNPGPGGSGSVIVRVHVQSHAARIVWMASMAMGSPKTTNNYAEYKGLVHGLRQAKVSGFTPLHVVGDSAMVLTQLCLYRTPRKPHLATLYRTARALADDVKVVSWAHHYREYNKMADFAANVAMDTESSIQVHAPTDRDLARQLEQHVQLDVSHWLETSIATDGGQNTGRSQTARERASAERQKKARRAAFHGVA